MLKRIGFVIVLGLMLGVALTACGSGSTQPAANSAPEITLSALPVFSGATDVSKSNDKVTSVIAAAQASGIYKYVDMGLYLLPSGTTWDAAKTFYSTNLESNGWVKKGTDKQNEQVWRRGQQEVDVSYIEVPNTGSGLTVLLTTDK